MTLSCNYNRKTNPIHKDGIYHIKASFFYFCTLHVITKKSNCCPHRDVFDITKVLIFLQITTNVEVFDDMYDVSIHAPTWGATQQTYRRISYDASFNPRPPRGGRLHPHRRA